MVTSHKQHQLDRLMQALHKLEQLRVPATLAGLASETAFSTSTLRSLIALLLAARQVAATPGRGGTRTFSALPAAAALPGAAGGGGPPPPPATPPQPPQPPAPYEPEPPKTPKPKPLTRGEFNARQMDRMVISLPLQQFMNDWQSALAAGAEPGDARLLAVQQRARVFDDGCFSVIIDLNTEYAGGVANARQRVLDLLLLLALGNQATPPQLAQDSSLLDPVAPPALRDIGEQYVVARLRPAQIIELVLLDQAAAATTAERSRRAVFRIWPDNVVRRQAFNSLPTIKADAARNSFGCHGQGIVWAVLDSGIDGGHLHFATHQTLQGLPAGVTHQDFTRLDHPAPLVDLFGHGTHVAGIIAGALQAQGDTQPLAVVYERDAHGQRQSIDVPLQQVSGVAPLCKLVSYKVLDDHGLGGETEVMAALEHILHINRDGKWLRIHGVNLSLGYRFDPQWYACGQSPLCEVVNRLARTGVCVVVAAGNSGYGFVDTVLAGAREQGMAMSINDPGNAESAITVGSTHCDAPHTYGVSYFSSKGPTGDGRNKPDLLAPGEKIVSCRSSSALAAAVSLAAAAAGGEANAVPAAECARYVEDSGTSMATPHVSGAIAALLSVRREFIGRSEEVKRVLLASALDLKRDRHMQGHGLLDLFSALQSI